MLWSPGDLLLTRLPGIGMLLQTLTFVMSALACRMDHRQG
jgi:hypothetical protein